MDNPELKKLMAAYFHQDFDEVHGGVWETVDAYVRADPVRASLLPAEIDRVLQELPTEDEVDRYLDGLGCQYLAAPEDGGYRGWLTEIARRVSEATRAAGRQP